MHTSNLSKLLNAVDKLQTKGSFGPDERFWKLEQDKAGNGMATIRFLPEKDENSLPFVHYFSHGFKGPTGKWFIENCPTTLGKDCPLCKKNGETWALNTDAAKTLVRERKRKLSYVANILVIDDPKNPDNNGKVFLLRFGKKIYDMIIEKIKPEFDDEQPINPFCPYTGANFRMKMHRVDRYPSYDKSSFAAPAALFDGDDAAIEKVLGQMHDLSDIVSADKFKSAEELERKLNSVLGGMSAQPQEEDEEFEQMAKEEPAAPISHPKARPVPNLDAVKADDSEDSEMAYFAKLAAM